MANVLKDPFSKEKFLLHVTEVPQATIRKSVLERGM